MSEQLFDVLAVRIRTGVERVIAEGKTEPNAKAVVKMAVARRGAEEEFFISVPQGQRKPPGAYGY